MRRDVRRDVPMNVQRVRAIVGAIMIAIGIGFFIFTYVKHTAQSKSVVIDLAFGALLIVVGLTRVLGYVRARRSRA